jgi:hypothetical protein
MKYRRNADLHNAPRSNTFPPESLENTGQMAATHPTAPRDQAELI